MRREIIVQNIVYTCKDPTWLFKTSSGFCRLSSSRVKFLCWEISFAILSDTNSHSSLYGSEITNKRGEVIENELVGPNNLLVLNEGNEPTFYSRRWGTSTHTDAIFAGPETSQFFSGFKKLFYWNARPLYKNWISRKT